MTLNEYVELVKANLDAFVVDYNKGIQATPNYFPAEMSEGEWDEQLMSFFAMQEYDDESK